MTRTPAVLGGAPVRDTELPVARPTMHREPALLDDIDEMIASGMLTNGRHVARFERDVADFVGVGHTVAVSSCTTGLLLLLTVLGRRGDAVLPSFTFMATGHAARWAGLTPVWADSDPTTCTVDPASASALVGQDTAVLVGVHTFGSPCDTAALAATAAAAGVPFIVDSAHAFGARYPDGTAVGSHALAEVFSLTPTKPLSTGEGGLVTTDDTDLAAELRVAREYGNFGGYDSRYPGLNGRMPEFAGLLGRYQLPRLPEVLARRRELAARYRERLSAVSGLSVQRIAGEPTFKDLVVLVDANGFGLHRDELASVLRAERIATRSYFDPPLHAQRAYRDILPVQALHGTAILAASALTLPLFSHMSDSDVDEVCEAIESAAAYAGPLAARLRDAGPQKEVSA